MLVLATLGAAERRRLRSRRGRTVEEGAPKPVPTTRATLVRPQPFETELTAKSWLDGLRSDESRVRTELAEGDRVLGSVLYAHRVAHADPYARDVSSRQALVVRIGFGDGEAVADGRYVEAWELPPEPRRRASRSMEAPEERFAALLGAREHVLVCEELVLRARADLDAERPRQAALQARVALESLLAELGGISHPSGGRRSKAIGRPSAMPPTPRLAVIWTRSSWARSPRRWAGWRPRSDRAGCPAPPDPDNRIFTPRLRNRR